MAGDASTTAPRSLAIDVIKGLAIVSVIFLHTLSVHALNVSASAFHISEAVPVFLFLMGLNAASSLRRRGARTLGELYTPGYLASRFDRVVVPYLVAFAATVLAVAITSTVHYSPVKLVEDLFMAQLPIDGPGNYFIALVFQFALLFPAVYWGLRRWPAPTLLLCLAIDVAFQAVTPHLGFFARHPYAYEVSLARYLFLVALGGLCAGVRARRLLGSPWLWGAALISIAYLVLVTVDVSAVPLGQPVWRNETFAAAFYPVLLVILALALMPTSGPVARHPLTRGLALLGRASYHIFLFQILWFGLVVWRGDSWAVLLGNLAVTLSVGVGFYLALARAPIPSLAGYVARHPTWGWEAHARPVGDS